MLPTNVTQEEHAQTRQELSKRISDVELHLNLSIGQVQVNVDELHNTMNDQFKAVDARFDEITADMNGRFMQVMAAFIPIYQALGIDTALLPKL